MPPSTPLDHIELKNSYEALTTIQAIEVWLQGRRPLTPKETSAFKVLQLALATEWATIVGLPTPTAGLLNLKGE